MRLSDMRKKGFVIPQISFNHFQLFITIKFTEYAILSLHKTTDFLSSSLSYLIEKISRQFKQSHSLPRGIFLFANAYNMKNAK